MNCKDFREIADSYLSDELAVETNRETFQHLESCQNCREELAMHREVRYKVRLSVKTSPEFQMNPGFKTRLFANLKNEAFRRDSRFSWQLLTPVLATILLVLSLTFVLLYQPRQNNYAPEFSQKAISRHEDCGIEHLQEWQEQAGKIQPEKTVFVKPLQSAGTEVLEVHDCDFEGKVYTHYVLRRAGKIISVIRTASESDAQTNSNDKDAIVCEKHKNWQMSRFTLRGEMIFVISDLPEAENLQLARQLSDANRL